MARPAVTIFCISGTYMMGKDVEMGGYLLVAAGGNKD